MRRVVRLEKRSLKNIFALSMLRDYRQDTEWIPRMNKENQNAHPPLESQISVKALIKLDDAILVPPARRTRWVTQTSKGTNR